MERPRNISSYRSRNSMYGTIPEPTLTSGLIEITPSDSLHFNYFEDGLIIANLNISNRTKTIKVFRILTTSSINYIVYPSFGILSSRDKPNSQIVINILMKGQKNIEKRLMDKFLIEALETLMNINDLKEEDLKKVNVGEIWREKNNLSVKYQKNILPISLVYSNKTSESYWASHPLLKSALLDPGLGEKSHKSETNYELIEKDYDNEGEILRKAKNQKGFRSNLSFFSETKRNISIYPESARDNNFEENYKQKYERLKKIADDQYNNIETIFKERDDYLNQINKLKFVYENKVYKSIGYDFFNNMSSIKIWQMLLVCVLFLIIGSFIAFIQTL